MTEGQRRVLKNETTEDIDLAGFAAALGSLDSTSIFALDRVLSRIVPPALLPKSGLVRDYSTIPAGSLSRVQGGNSIAQKSLDDFLVKFLTIFWELCEAASTGLRKRVCTTLRRLSLKFPKLADWL